MKFTNHIALSLLLHIFLFGMVMIYRPEINRETEMTVFDVDIITPEERPVIPPPVIKKPSPPIPLKDKTPLMEETPPKTMLGDGTDPEPSQEAKKQGSEKVHPEKILGELRIPEPDEEKKKEGMGSTFLKGDKGDQPGGFSDLPSSPGELLFDNEIIEKYAQRENPEEKDLTFDAPEFHNRGYMRMLKDKIERIWKYPKDAALRRISGDLYIRFSIRRDGSVGDITLVRTSGYHDLDKAALQAVKDGEPYWPLPDDWEEEELSITGHFIYVIGRYYML
ncbi:energy transducer TonB [bacterium]|nr:MAG: energy transducer TonB [bacterium]